MTARNSVPNVFRAPAAAIVLLMAVGPTAACSPFHAVYDVGNLDPGDKVIVGEVRVVNGDLAQWVDGIFMGAGLVVDYKLPTHHGRVGVAVGDGEGVRSLSFAKQGGPFSVGVKNQNLLVMAIGVQSTYLLANVSTVYPLLVLVKPSPNRCEYVGTLLVSRDGRRISTDVEDHYDEFRARYPSFVSGCPLAKNLGTALLPKHPE